MAVSRSDSISVANVDGTEWKNTLPFEQVLAANQWSFVPVVVPLTDGSGFRVVIPPHDLSTDPNALSKFWQISLKEEPVLLHSFLERGGLFLNALSPDGNAIVYSKTDTDGGYSFCSYQHINAQETCTVALPVWDVSWATDASKYNYHTLIQVLVEEKYVDETVSYISSSTELDSSPVQIDNYFWLAWVNPQQYLYIDEGWGLRLATVGSSNILIHNGVKNLSNDDGILPFDFSTR